MGSDGSAGNISEPEEPGSFGSPEPLASYEMKSAGFIFNLGTILTVILSCIGGIVWLVQLDGKLEAVQRNQLGKDSGVAIRAELQQVRDRQIDIISRLEKYDAGGTQALVILRERLSERLSQLAADVAGQSLRSQDIAKTVAELQRTVIQNDVQMRTLASIKNRKE